MVKKKVYFFWVTLGAIILFFSFISAQFIGIERLSGTPRIISCEPEVIGPFGKGLPLKVTFRNIGDETGNFQIYWDCAGNIDSFPLGLIDSGETSSFDIRRLDIYLEQITESDIINCEIAVRDTGSFYQKNDTCEILVKVEKCNGCFDEGIKCNQERGYLEECASHGCGMDIVEYCSEGCGWDKRAYEVKCKEDFEKADYKPLYKPLYIVIALAIVAYLIYLTSHYRKAKKRKREWSFFNGFKIKK